MSRADHQKVQASVDRVMRYFEGAMVSAMIHLGDRLGLYQGLLGVGPVTAEELAARTGLNERWVREWLRGQSAAGLIEYRGDGRFELTAESALVLADEGNPWSAIGRFGDLPQVMAVIERLPEAFRTGKGLSYDAQGPAIARMVERVFAPWYRSMLVGVALPLLDGVVAKLSAGAKVADVGCGAGVALLEQAREFPKSEFHGYEISAEALARARANRLQSGVANVEFHDAREQLLPEDGSLDLVNTFDCLHDMTNPGEVAASIRRSLKPDGTWFIIDPNVKATFEENLAHNPLAARQYAISVAMCMSASLSEGGGAGLGTLGLPEPAMRELAGRAGFTHFRRLELETPVNAFYEARP